ncbi:hypothetical protein M406DRAFT_354996 [Cryphonectria parasitica EP155]|uniref:Uncharacterized protein n=1 Tax=Cryphonectria parasitica (strain ATCC 38755 / EP155) TaxID=660469 RepID=A0A9P4Y9Y5_CRYP1|nr:uncharacterized protein M406DRAFT_354996 [Cryphonectria parasitica EP155]KAF3768750.1 hypothetical protein M406DRAFT_354996 [Cryphonectria parasitica EP155]
MAKGKFEAAAALLSVFGSPQIEFCNSSVYAVGPGCPADPPLAGGGTCYNLTISTPQCYTWADFPDAPSDLVDDVNFVYVPESLGGCNLYKTLNCTTTPDEEWDAVAYGLFDLEARSPLCTRFGFSFFSHYSNTNFVSL